MQLFEFEEREPVAARTNALHLVRFLKAAKHPNAVLARHQLARPLLARRAPGELDEHFLDDVKLEIFRHTRVVMVQGCAVLHAS